MELAPVFGASLEACGELSSSLEAYSVPRSAIWRAGSRGCGSKIARLEKQRVH